MVMVHRRWLLMVWAVIIFTVALLFGGTAGSDTTRLVHGTTNQGIVQILVETSWLTLCAWPKFGDGDATVICRELGYLRGSILPHAAFGPFTNNYTAPFRGCTGSEQSISECSFDESYVPDVCKTQNTYYGAVWCFNVSSPKDYEVEILPVDGASSKQNFGPVQISIRDQVGQICTSYWTEVDANVTCSQLGYLGGVSTVYPAIPTEPFLLTGVQCKGPETTLKDCSKEVQICYDNNLRAGVICYNDSAPQVYLEHQEHDFGRVIIRFDGRNGTICNEDWDSLDAAVVCRHIGYITGDVLYGPHIPIDADVVMNKVNCHGGENSILDCRSSGWNPETNCSHGEAAVRCYDSIRLSGGTTTDDIVMGRVEVYQKRYWTTLCAHDFDKNDADVICRQLGYPKSKLLLPGTFGRPTYYVFTTSIRCFGNESTLLECPHTMETCKYSQYATMMCIEDRVSDDMSLSLSKPYGGAVEARQWGIKGTVCTTGWDDRDARVVCTFSGFKAGQVFGTSLKANIAPVWVTNVQCNGTEAQPYQCNVNFTAGSECGKDDAYAAGVICYNGTGMSVRIVGGSDTNEGRVEVSRDGVWGTVCDNQWTTYDANVVCRQLGYAGGNALRGSRHGAGTGPVFMGGLRCKGEEKTIFECPNDGWGIQSSTCTGHTRDASVYCYKWVQLSSTYFGAVQYWKGGQYGLVCGDTFDDAAASVVCKELGYLYSVRLCCDAVGRMDQDYTLVGVQCKGNETSLNVCPVAYGNVKCTGGYAAVYCTGNNPASTLVRSSIPSNGRGLVRINYVYRDGYVCAENFTRFDAQVVCRENGYPFSLRMRLATPAKDFTHSTMVRWANGLGCNGGESHAGQCLVRIGQLGGCDQEVSAGVICSKSADNFEVRLQNGSSGREGRVEIFVDGVWGSLCVDSLTDAEARVICRQLRKRDGVALPAGYYGGGGPTYIDYLKCNGTESNMPDCVTNIPTTSTSSCSRACAIRCYETVRITGSSTVEFGRPELWHKDKWTPVCDAAFDDKEANVVCRYLGYVAGKSFCCSAVGSSDDYNRTESLQMDCSGSESSPQLCNTLSVGRCSTGHYASVYCMDSARTEDVTVSINGPRYYGPLLVSRYGLKGYVCHDEFDLSDAVVACKTLKYQSGYKLKVMKERNHPVIMGQVNCTSTGITDFKFCRYNTFGTDVSCRSDDIVAGVMCYSQFKLAIEELSTDYGLIKIVTDSGVIYFDYQHFNDYAANLACKALNYAGGVSVASYHTKNGTVGLYCQGNETSLTDCKGSWGSTSKDMASVASVRCHKGVRLARGGVSYGAVEVYKGDNWGTVCPQFFDLNEAELVCKTVGYTSAIPLCCSTFGSVDSMYATEDLSCAGQETTVSECPFSLKPRQTACSNPWEYAAVTCYNGSRPTDFSVNIKGQSYFSDVIITYMGIPGRICNDDWDNKDAEVVCRQLNYVTGYAYSSFVEEGERTNGPYWLTKVQCSGTERLLSECSHSGLGSATECTSRHYAGVLCLDNEGLFYRISGGDPNGRSGRAEVFLKNVWGTICNQEWSGEEARVLCRQFGYKDGDPFSGPYRLTTNLTSIYEPNFVCTGNEDSLNQCPHSGWFYTNNPACSNHQNDAGVFCYDNVKIYNSLGREKSEGPVLLYRDDTWYLVCDDGFTDDSAAVVCRELGFADGHAKCCSAHGQIQIPVWRNETLTCNYRSESVRDCLERGQTPCMSKTYASVTCSHTPLPPRTTTSAPVPATPAPMTQDNNTVVIAVVVSCLLFILILGAVILVIIKFRASYGQPKGRFNPSILQRQPDGSFSLENPLSQMDQPAVDTQINMNRQDSVVGYRATESSGPTSYTNATYQSANDVRSQEHDGATAAPEDVTIDHDDKKPLSPDSAPSEDSSYIDVIPNFNLSCAEVYYDNDVKRKDDLRRSLAESKEIQSPQNSIEAPKTS